MRSKVLALMGVWVVACSGSLSSAGLFSDGDTSLPSTDGGPDASFSATDTGAGSTDATSKDADTGPVKEASPPPDVTPPPTPQIACGTSSCNAPSETCCGERNSNGSFKSQQCKTFGSCGTGKIAIICDSDDDCTSLGLTGKACCVNASDFQGRASSVACTSATECTSFYGRTRFCDPKAATSVCEQGQVCRESTNTLPGYFLCLPPN